MLDDLLFLVTEDMIQDEEGPSVPTDLLSSSDYEPQAIGRSDILLAPMVLLIKHSC
jgi:hypothetical protein